MQIPKVLPLACALALGSILSVKADDNSAQAAAMAALNEKMAQLDQQPSNAVPPTVDDKAQAQNLVTEQKQQEKEAAKKAAKAKKEAEKQARAEAKAAREAQEKAAADQKIADEAQRQQDQQALAAQKASDMTAMGAAASIPPSQPVQPAVSTPPAQSYQPVQSSQQLNDNQAAAMAALNKAMSEPAPAT